MTKRELAQKRNWNKARIISNIVDRTVLTLEEDDIIQQISKLKNLLLEKWDENSKKLGLKVERYNIYYNGEIIIENATETNYYFYKKSYKESFPELKITFKKIQ